MSNFSATRMNNTLQAGTVTMQEEENQTYPIHNNQTGLSYIFQGKGEYYTDSGEHYPFYPGCISFWKPLKKHYRKHAKGTFSDKWLALPPEYYFILESMKLVSPQTPVTYIGVSETILKTFDALALELHNQAEKNLIKTANRMFDFICTLFLPQTDKNNKWQKQMEKAMRILEDLECQDSIAVIAQKLDMSLANFRRIFTATYGMSPSNYRVTKRLEKAQQHLLARQLSISEISLKLGYNDVYSFSHQFKKFVGISPRKYAQERIWHKF